MSDINRDAGTAFVGEQEGAEIRTTSSGWLSDMIVIPDAVRTLSFGRHPLFIAPGALEPAPAKHALLLSRAMSMLSALSEKPIMLRDVMGGGQCYASTLPLEQDYADASTSLEKQEAADEAITEHFRKWLRIVFNLGANEVFEDGMETEFSRELVECVEAGSSSAVRALRMLLDQSYAGPEVGGEALRWLGCVDQRDTHDVRRLALEHYLRAESVYLSDGAAIGLSEMDDPAALSAVAAAISKGGGPLIVMRLKQLQEQLEDTKSCRTSSE